MTAPDDRDGPRRVTGFVDGGVEYLVLSLPAEAPRGLPLSDAERDVVAALLAGDSNRDIAARRGTSVRTVANQVASIFRKLGVASRAELASRLSGGASAK